MKSTLLLPMLTMATVACARTPPPSTSTTAEEGVAKTLRPETPTQSERTLDRDETLTTPSGATFQAARGWHIETRGAMMLLKTPERDVSVALMASDEQDPDRAIANAWKMFAPTFSRSVKRRVTPPPRDGWSALTQHEYETGTGERRIVIGLALAESARQHVMLFDGDAAGFDRRGAQLGTIQASYKPKGLASENLATRQARDLDPARLASFKSFAESARDALKVPGAAVAIVQHGKVVLAEGLGTREQGKNAPVTPKTLFMIGSTTKSLTTLMMARLVDEGLFDWDTPVTKLLPSFALGDSSATREITVRHTVCACTGMPRQDEAFLFEYAGVTPEMRIASLRDVKPTTGFGETFQYSNMLVAAGGFIAAHAAAPGKAFGPAFDATIRSRLLDPLGMRRTTSNLAAVQRTEHALPHGLTAGLEPARAPLVTEEGVVAIRPAGALWSNVEEMARVLTLELGRGSVDGKRIVSEENLLLRRKPQVKITGTMSYGIGLFVEDDHGVPVVGHGGNNLGFTSDFFFLPDHDLGMVVLTNAGSANGYRRVLRRKLLELVFDAKDESTELLRFSVARQKEHLESELARVERTPSPDLVAPLVGTYTNPTLGKITIRSEKRGPVLDVGEWSSAFGVKTEKDGGKKLFLLDPPWLGFELILTGSAEPMLTIEAGQDRYPFRRADAKNSGG